MILETETVETGDDLQTPLSPAMATKCPRTANEEEETPAGEMCDRSPPRGQDGGGEHCPFVDNPAPKTEAPEG
ncbi:hypothetical protein AWZ03_015236 [Drosophila navojoa]|uniref:Uncharacterized protein n=1 Tax=Drosophila navojoa TaxID=7232 RepID=A0A484AQ90_DRONA|nr:hypothetical protein AWZ03_015236 [Drosophila navojoa]